MTRCRTCGKRLLESDKKFCESCHKFHLYRYPKEERRSVRKEYAKTKD